MAVTVTMDEQRDARLSVVDDAEAWAIAEDIHKERPDWLVMWGVYSRQFVAYPLFSMQRRVIVTAHYPDALIDRLDRAEKQWRIWPR